jgi:hypothetical protein
LFLLDLEHVAGRHDGVSVEALELLIRRIRNAHDGPIQALVREDLRAYVAVHPQVELRVHAGRALIQENDGVRVGALREVGREELFPRVLPPGPISRTRRQRSGEERDGSQ